MVTQRPVHWSKKISFRLWQIDRFHQRLFECAVIELHDSQVTRVGPDSQVGANSTIGEGSGPKQKNMAYEKSNLPVRA